MKSSTGNLAKAGRSGDRSARSDSMADVSDARVQEVSAIDQIRDLLFGGTQRSLEKDLSELRDEMHGSVAQLRTDLFEKITALETRLSNLEIETERRRLKSMRDVGAAISQIGTFLSQLDSVEAN